MRLASTFRLAGGSRALRAALTGLSTLALGLAATDVEAGWPPPLSATADDMKNPANWPSDPDYGYVASSKPSERESGQWQFYSFIPERSTGSFVPTLRPEEKASGMSVDLAWRHTIGEDRVLIAVGTRRVEGRGERA